MFKVLSEQLWNTLTATFEERHVTWQKHLTIEDFTDMDQRRCRAYTNTFDLILYAFISLKET